jgi:energy-coupling factor transporter ATP-binding protein EcfA2
MPMGYNTLIGDMGTALSGGQKQRVLLARALYRRPGILFLDEATSHLDVEREKAVNDALRTLRLTRIVIAHRLETIRAADRVITLEAGAITEGNSTPSYGPKLVTVRSGAKAGTITADRPRPRLRRTACSDDRLRDHRAREAAGHPAQVRTVTPTGRRRGRQSHEAMGVVDEMIQDGVGDGRIANQFVPMIHGELAGDDGRGASMPVIEDVQETAPLLGRERRQASIIQDQKLDSRQGLEQTLVTSIPAREQQGIEQPWQTMVEDRTAVAASPLVKGAGNKTHADANRPDDQQVVMTSDPIAADELGEEGLVEPARHIENGDSMRKLAAKQSEFEAGATAKGNSTLSCGRGDGTKRFAKAYGVADDLEQAQSRVYELCSRLVEASAADAAEQRRHEQDDGAKRSVA